MLGLVGVIYIFLPLEWWTLCVDSIFILGVVINAPRPLSLWHSMLSNNHSAPDSNLFSPLIPVGLSM